MEMLVAPAGSVKIDTEGEPGPRHRMLKLLGVTFTGRTFVIVALRAKGATMQTKSAIKKQWTRETSRRARGGFCFPRPTAEITREEVNKGWSCNPCSSAFGTVVGTDAESLPNIRLLVIARRGSERFLDAYCAGRALKSRLAFPG